MTILRCEPTSKEDSPTRRQPCKTKIINRGIQITENCHQLLTTCEAEARRTRGDRTTSPSSANGNGSIDVSRSSPEAQMERCFLQLEDEVGHFTHGKNACLHFLPLFMAQRAIGKLRPLLQVETGLLMPPERCWKRKLNVISCSWQAKLNTLDTEKNLLACNF